MYKGDKVHGAVEARERERVKDRETASRFGSRCTVQ